MASPKVCINNNGFTVIELVMVMALLMIVSSLGLFMSMETMRGQTLLDDRAAVISALQRARGLAVNNICFGDISLCGNGKSHGVHFSSTGIVIFQGDSYVESDSANEAIDFDSKLTGIGSGSAADIIFNRLSGNLVSDTGATSSSVILTAGTGKEITINVNSEGRIDWSD